MTRGLESLARNSATGKGYLYVNRSTVIPFGWNGRPVESTASTGWAYYLQNLKNPFVLGGLTRWAQLADFAREVSRVKGGLVAVLPIRAQKAISEPEAAPAAAGIDKILKHLEGLDIADPSAAKGSTAFQEILGMGHSAYPALQQIVLNH
jgi:hypothetical protein